MSGGRGFTLVEVVVAMAILSLVMLATVSGLRTLAATQSSLEQVAQRNDDLRSVSSFLRGALESAVVGAGIPEGLTLGGGMDEKALFEIRGDTLLWRTVMLMGESTGGSYVVRVGREDDELRLRWTSVSELPADFDWNTAPGRTLVSGLQSFEVAYRRAPDGAWLDEWDQRGPPGWVRLRIRSAQRYWPDIIAEVAR